MDQGLLLVEKTKSERKKIIQALKGVPSLQRFYEAETLSQGIGILSKEKIDLILYFSGNSVDRKPVDLTPLLSLREHDAGRDVPLLFIASGGKGGEGAALLEKGAWDYIHPPFKLEDLILRTKVLLRIKAGQDKLKSRIRQLEKLSIIDPLTGLYNRKYLKEFLRREVKRAERQNTQIYCMMMDVDHFKEINDQLGHPKGDQVLVEVGTTLRDLLRGYDFAARYGGDEFAIILPQRMEERSAAAVGERIRRRIEEQTFGQKRGKGQVRFTVSLGISVYPSPDVKSEEGLITAADEALYSAKRGGKNRVVFYRPASPGEE